MDEYRFFTSFYGSLVEKSWMHPNTYTPLRRVTRILANKRLPRFFGRNPFENKVAQTESGLIASFTSFPARIEYAYLIVYCMLHQTIRPEKLFLWLSKEQFKDKNALPSKLLTLENDFFEIRMVDGDIRSHKKYYYVCREFRDAKVILLDDDIIYSPNLVESLLSAYNNGDSQIVCNYAHLIQRDLDGHLLPYKQWKYLHQESKGNDVFFGSGGGTLLRPRDFDPLLTDIQLIQSLTPTADDIWLNSIARLSKLSIRMITHGGFLPIIIENNECLYSSNIYEDKNDLQLNKVCNYFGATDYLFERLG